MKKFAFLAGLVTALLGGLWLLQGLGIVQMQPILCFANCAAVQGSSTTWAVLGSVVFTAGAAVMYWSLKWRAG